MTTKKKTPRRGQPHDSGQQKLEFAQGPARVVAVEQPWASLVAAGRKRTLVLPFDPRERGRTYTGEVFVCAVVRGPHDLVTRARRAGVKDALRQIGVKRLSELASNEIIAGARLVSVEPIPLARGEGRQFFNRLDDEGELELDDFDAGKFLWRLANVVALERPLAFEPPLAWSTVSRERLSKAEVGERKSEESYADKETP